MNELNSLIRAYTKTHRFATIRDERIECKCVISVIVDMLGWLPTSDDASDKLTNSLLQGDI